jgi:aminomethyltransferase
VIDLWDRILDKGRDFGVKPVGLGARDTLRLEMCYPLHGHELSEDVSALESGLGWIVKFGKDEFIGKQALLRQKKAGVPRDIVALIVRDAGVIRGGDLVYNQEGDQIGVVTSGTKTPTINRALGLALIVRRYAKVGQQVFVNVRGRLLAAEQVVKPFLKR